MGQLGCDTAVLGKKDAGFASVLQTPEARGFQHLVVFSHHAIDYSTPYNATDPGEAGATASMLQSLLAAAGTQSPDVAKGGTPQEAARGPAAAAAGGCWVPSVDTHWTARDSIDWLDCRDRRGA